MSRHNKKFKVNNLCDKRDFRNFLNFYRKDNKTPIIFTGQMKKEFWNLLGHDPMKHIDDVTLNKLFNMYLESITVPKPSRIDFANALKVYRAWFDSHRDLIQSAECIEKINRLIDDEQLFERIIMVNDGSFLNNRISILHLGSYNTPSVEFRDASLTINKALSMSTNDRIDHMIKTYGHICCQFKLDATIESIDEEIEFRNKMDMEEAYE